MIVYNQKENSCIDVFSGSNLIRIGIPGPDATKNAMIHGANGTLQLKLNDNFIYNINGFSFASLSDINKVEAVSSPTFILLNGNKKMWFPKLADKFPSSVVVSDGTNRFSKNIKWKNAADSLNLKFWSTSEKGAFTLNHNETTDRR
jgi:hypothetical protein